MNTRLSHRHRTPMYSIEYLPAALRDLQDITRYIATSPGNPAAARSTTDKIVAATERLAPIPYRHAVYVPLKPLAREYRAIRSGNYLAFYWVEEHRKAVVIARVVYGKADVSARLSAAERQL